MEGGNEASAASGITQFAGGEPKRRSAIDIKQRLLPTPSSISLPLSKLPPKKFLKNLTITP